MKTKSIKTKVVKDFIFNDLGKEVSKFPLMFAAPILMGEYPPYSSNSKINCGTATLLNINTCPFVITCNHVLKQYEDLISEKENITFQVGNLQIDPLANLVEKSDRLDLAIISLRNENIKKISDSKHGPQFYNPVTWPPKEIKIGDILSFGGFPGIWREHTTKNEINFYSFSHGATIISAISDENITCQFEREDWVKSHGKFDNLNFNEFGGISGAPVFVQREFHSELIGIVHEFNKAFDLLNIKSLKYINENGKINHAFNIF